MLYGTVLHDKIEILVKVDDSDIYKLCRSDGGHFTMDPKKGKELFRKKCIIVFMAVSSCLDAEEEQSFSLVRPYSIFPAGIL